jgi:hypothetical protein
MNRTAQHGLLVLKLAAGLEFNMQSHHGTYRLSHFDATVASKEKKYNNDYENNESQLEDLVCFPV